jgi:hypothetical protein
MVSVLFLVGQLREEPSIIEMLLDIKNTPGKPQYDMADDLPLVLWDCGYEENALKDWQCDVGTVESLLKHFWEFSWQHSVRLSLFQLLLGDLSALGAINSVNENNKALDWKGDEKKGKYVPLLLRDKQGNFFLNRKNVFFLKHSECRKCG